ncbi:MAG TPA: nucleotidyltransferase family protein [Noviherbaspirillum sp.]|jgi:hypothetical protein|uniref:nucleotidyltransferase family protein n=1 Tax=Noviherbaspirillum sp. TaxID=1926288 RepID=UPI002DDC9C75|nr:nucleotidyltransferase family protein [Noviherbaspirillum sp.]HEV2612571.1 nucleotidyltransferase family protein [Noviherbaspirillum sp.]
MTDTAMTEALIRADKWRMDCLAVVKTAGLPDWLVVAGFVRNLIWDHLHGKTIPTPLNDVDVAIFDPSDLTPAMEQDIESILRSKRPKVNWQVRNQARMHLRNGHAPYRDTADAISYYPEQATCVGVRLSAASEVEVAAPFGLAHNWNLSITPNPKAGYVNSVFMDRVKSKRWLETWPALEVESRCGM